MSVRAIATAAISALALASLAACGSSTGRNVKTPSVSFADAPESGIVSVSEVVVRPGKNPGTYQFEATSGPGYGVNDILPTIYCRVDRMQAEKGFAGWKVKTIQRQEYARANSPQIVIAVIEFFPTTLPADHKPATRDFCAEVGESSVTPPPAAAAPSVSAPAPAPVAESRTAPSKPRSRIGETVGGIKVMPPPLPGT